MVVQLYGKEGLSDEPRIYRTKSKNAQEAHEAIRPTAANILPADIESKLESDQYRLYIADLAAHRGLPDGPGGVRHGRC